MGWGLGLGWGLGVGARLRCSDCSRATRLRSVVTRVFSRWTCSFASESVAPKAPESAAARPRWRRCSASALRVGWRGAAEAAEGAAGGFSRGLSLARLVTW